MATGVEKSHPRGHRIGSLPGGKVFKNRGFRPFEPPAPQLAHELRFWANCRFRTTATFRP